MSNRTFVLTTPPMHGNDVRDFQHQMNLRLKAWGIDQRLKEDGKWNVISKRTCASIGFGLGLDAAAIEQDGVTPWVRVAIRHAGDAHEIRSIAERQRARDRRPWVDRLGDRLSHPGNGPAAAVAYAEKMLATRPPIVEHPSGSNRGPYIDQWEVMSGYPGSGVSWCLCFVNGSWVAGGWPASLLPWTGFCPNLEKMAQAGLHGLKWHDSGSAPKAAWAVLFTEDGEAGHVELVLRDGWPLLTAGGNTHPTNGAVAANGGMVAEHNFSTYHGLPRRGFVELPWATL